jgi:hypothetical protein
LKEIEKIKKGEFFSSKISSEKEFLQKKQKNILNQYFFVIVFFEKRYSLWQNHLQSSSIIQNSRSE